MEMNLFKLCYGLRVPGYFMIFLLAEIIGVSYYAVVLLTCGPQLLRGGFHSFLFFTIIIEFLALLILLLWSYLKVVFKTLALYLKIGEQFPWRIIWRLVVLWQWRMMDWEKITWWRRRRLLHPLQEWEASAVPSLFCLSKMCSQDGPPLCLGGELCWSMQL